MRSAMLYGCKTYPVRVTDERVLAVFDNDSIPAFYAVVAY